MLPQVQAQASHLSQVCDVCALVVCVLHVRARKVMKASLCVDLCVYMCVW